MYIVAFFSTSYCKDEWTLFLQAEAKRMVRGMSGLLVRIL